MVARLVLLPRSYARRCTVQTPANTDTTSAVSRRNTHTRSAAFAAPFRAGCRFAVRAIAGSLVLPRFCGLRAALPPHALRAPLGYRQKKKKHAHWRFACPPRFWVAPATATTCLPSASPPAATWFSPAVLCGSRFFFCLAAFCHCYYYALLPRFRLAYLRARCR